MTTILIIDDSKDAERTLIAAMRQAIEGSAAAGAVSLQVRPHGAFVDAVDQDGPAVSHAPVGGEEPVARAGRGDWSPVRSATSMFRLEGEYWTIAHHGRVLRLRDSKGLRYLAYLLRYPGQMFRALDVVAAVHQGAAPASMDGHQALDRPSGPVADRRALSEYRRRVGELGQEIADAKEQNDLGRVAALQAEAEWLAKHLSDACGLGGRLRELPSIAERARQTLTKGVRNACGRIERGDAALARYFTRHIKTGQLCGYEPDPDRLITWEF